MELHRAVSTEFGGHQAQPGVVESQFGLLNAVQRPQITTLGREAYATFNMGVGIVIVCSPSNASTIESHLKECYRIGEVVPGNREVLI